MSSVEATAAWGLSNTNGFSKDHEDLNYQLALGWTNPRYPIFFVRYPINILHIAILSPSCPTIYHYIPILNRLVLSQLFEKNIHYHDTVKIIRFSLMIYLLDMVIFKFASC